MALTATAALAATLLLPVAANAEPAAEREDARATAGNPLELTDGFYVNPDSTPAAWVRANPGDSRAQEIDEAIAQQPTARWFTDTSGDVVEGVTGYTTAAQEAGELPVLVAYNIPGRDCGGHSDGGAGSPEAYRQWITDFATSIGDRPAIVILEPDALAQLDCMPSDDERRVRTELIRHATEQLSEHAVNTWTYLDSGTARWVPAEEMAERLDNAGQRNAHGFVNNVSNYYTTEESAGYSRTVAAHIEASHGYRPSFAVDTSRNGHGSIGEWCNPDGRKLGTPPQVGGEAELLLWVKVPGNSDGECGIAPDTPAGVFSPEVAKALIDGAWIG
ncbi:glycoside hydrolase family 6 protein [Streptomyces profundus]|nr:glycoside hydrolase family 6 protein [Streptomyces sp. MA3_2.13]